MRALSHFWRLTRQDNFVAQELLERAIAIDPNFGQALGVLASSHVMSAYMGWTDAAAVVPIAERAALAAIRADSDDPWARHALGCVHLISRRFRRCPRRARVGAEPQSKLRASPKYIRPYFYRFFGRWEDAYTVVTRALRLSPRDPLSALYNGIAAYAQFVGRNYQEAMRLARASIRLRGDYVGGHRVLCAAAAMAGQGDIAASALDEVRRAQPNFSLAWVASSLPFKRDADREHFLEAFRRAGLK